MIQLHLDRAAKLAARVKLYVCVALSAFALAGPLGDGWIAGTHAQEAVGQVEQQNRAPLQGHGARICKVRYSPDGASLLTASFDGNVKLWDASTGIERLNLSSSANGGAVDVAMSPDGSTIVTVGDDRTVRLWDAMTGRQVRKVGRFDEDVASVLFSPDGRTLLVGTGRHDPKYGRNLELGGNGYGRLWFFDPHTGQGRLTNVCAHSSRISHLQFTKDGNHLITAAGENTVSVWRWADDKPPFEIQSISVGTSPQDIVLDISSSPDGKTLAVVLMGVPSSIELYELETGQKQPALFNLNSASPIYWECAAFSPDGKQLLVGGVFQEVIGDFEVFERSEVRVWDLKTRIVAKTLKVDEFVRSLAVSPDGGELSVGCGGRQKAPNRQRESSETVVESRGIVFRWTNNR